MEFVRPFDDAQAVDTGFPLYRAQFLSHMESALLIASTIGEGGCGPSLHYHHSDQLYYLMRGSMTVQLGNDTHKITAGTLVYIPAGLAHCNWNDGPGAETHFEMIVPAPMPGTQIALLVDSPDDVPAGRRATVPGYVQALDPKLFQEPIPGFRLQPLADAGTGAKGLSLNYAEVAPGAETPGTHVHDTDQYYLVLEGELTVEVALTTYTVGAESLVLLPAGVPHRQYNAGAVTEKHLALLAPAPAAGQPWDRGVTLSATGETHVGVSTGGTTEGAAR
ncbi:cupin domain-containing protein [Streptomyces justiciae]|uniref:cupin domain-containing protein n=1 Tax=Streptomyces justiciae TaxID=2780140 RepID=UPI00211852E6|nr:cupin domain-containing protein [Streptomyces justiciae]MCW8378713.1 cupin domain-containing protein [Streptomyces justiciae]